MTTLPGPGVCGSTALRMRANPTFLLQPLEPETVLRIQSIDRLRDIHDRLIVAEPSKRALP